MHAPRPVRSEVPDTSIRCRSFEAEVVGLLYLGAEREIKFTGYSTCNSGGIYTSKLPDRNAAFERESVTYTRQ